MKFRLAFILLVLTAGPVVGQGLTIDQLSPGSALTGVERLPMFQGTNPAVTTTPGAIASVNRALNAKDPPFSAICNGSTHPLSTRFSTLAAAQAVYPFITSTAQEQDYAALKLMSNTALGADGSEHGSGGATANIPMYIPAGICQLGNDTWKIRNASGVRLDGAGTTATIIQSNGIAFQTDGLWYSNINYMTFNTQGSSVPTALDIDGNTGTAGYTTFGVQADTFIGINAQNVGQTPPTLDGGGNCTAGACYAVAVCRQGQSSGQCSEMVWVNFHGQGGQEAVFFQKGFNAIDNVLVGGDLQGYPKNGIELQAGSVKVLGMSFESTRGYTQIANSGCDVQASAGGVNDSVIVLGSRSESLCLYNGGFSQQADISGFTQIPAGGTWVAGQVYTANVSGVTGTDSSGNAHFFLATSVAPESVTGHFASSSWVGTAPSGFVQIPGEVWSRVATNITLSGSNLVATQNANDATYSPGYGGTGETSGLWYWEILSGVSSHDQSGVGVGNTLSSIADGQYLGIGHDTIGYFTDGKVYVGASSSAIATLQPFTFGANLGVALDLGNHKIWFRACPTCGWNNDVIANQNPATNTGGITLDTAVYTNPVVPAFNTYYFSSGGSGATQPVWPSSGSVTDAVITWTQTTYNAIKIAEGSIDLRNSYIDPGGEVVPGTVPAVTSCGGGSPFVEAGGTRYSGTVDEGTTASGCTIGIAFHRSRPAPRCNVNALGNPPLAALTSYSVTQDSGGNWLLTLVNPSANGARFSWNCQQG